MRWWEMVSKPEHGRAGAVSILLREPELPFLDGRVGFEERAADWS